MNTSYIAEKPWRSLGWIICVLLALLILIEGWHYFAKPNISHRKEIIAKNLKIAASNFQSRQQKLLRQTQRLAEELQSQIPQKSPITLYETLQDYSHFWGAALISGDEPVVWNGFSLGVLQSVEQSDSLNTYIEIKKQNNVLFWLAHAGFATKSEDDSTAFHLFTMDRIIQTNALQIGDEREYSILEDGSGRYSYPLSISIYKPLPNQQVHYQILKNASQDSIGIVYAVPGHFQEVLNQWKNSIRLWRSLFAIFCFVVLLGFVTFWIDLKSAWKNLLVQLLIIGIGWVFFEYLSIAIRWLPDILKGVPPDMLASYQQLCAYIIDSIFLFLGAYAMHNALKKPPHHFGNIGKILSSLAGFISGIIATIIITISFGQFYRLIVTTSFTSLNLQIIPPLGTIFVYLGFGIMFWGITLLIIAINRFILHLCRYHYKWAIATATAGFLLGLLIIQEYSNGGLYLNWQFFISFIFYTLTGLLSFVYFKFPLLIARSSTLRNVAVATFILTIVGTTFIYYGHMDTQNEKLIKTAQSYARQQEETARNLTATLLTTLQRQYFALTKEDLKKRASFIQARFTQTVKSTINEQAPFYTLHLQLISAKGKRIAEYSNALVTPAWVNYFNPSRFYTSILIEGISKNFIRPVIQQPQLINQQEYNTFYRGWIPIYGPESNIPIAWIIGSVYRERPDFNKPMQAVMASLSYDNWKQPMVIQQYKNGKLSGTTYHSTGGYFPIYTELPTKDRVFKGDSLYFYNSENAQNSYRNLLLKQSKNEVLKVSIILPDLHNILFSFFRLNFTLLIAGFIASMFFQLIKKGKIVLVDKNNKFQYRILDSFLLATLIFLILIIAGSYYALNQQNSSLVKQQLLNKLESIEIRSGNTASLEANTTGNQSTILNPLTEQLNADASFYTNKTVTKSTTPQIYQQHLLPAALPFPVYYQLFKSKKKSIIQTIKLADQPLFIGYRALLSANNEPFAAIAIPTFVQSPKYRGQLMETTSYLVMLYLLIFGAFIVETIIISRQLTKPLYDIRKGLHKISKGDLDTTIPVKSKDEIGILASSYNRMTTRLKKLQEELAKTEREAAWKEIAQQAAHEIKNPLTPMKLNIQHLRHQVTSNEKDREELKEKIIQISENIMLQIESMNTIATNFLTYSTHGDGDFEEININKLITRIANLHKHHENKTLEISTASTAVVNGVEEELYRAILNLVKNAYEATSKGGVIQLRSYTDEDHVFVEVEDQGIGITDENKDDIFTPNFSTKTSGTGLGLAICKKIITTHHGNVTFTSEMGKGTTFTIRLPRKK